MIPASVSMNGHFILRMTASEIRLIPHEIAIEFHTGLYLDVHDYASLGFNTICSE